MATRPTIPICAPFHRVLASCRQRWRPPKLAERTGNDVLRGSRVRIGARVIFRARLRQTRSDRHSTHSVATNFGATAAAAPDAAARSERRAPRVFFAAQQPRRAVLGARPEHVEKALRFRAWAPQWRHGGPMIASGFTGVDDS